jgi:hypothetical protein
MEKQYYTAREAAAYLGIPMHRLSRLRRLGRIKSIVDDAEPRYAVYHIDELKRVDTADKRRGKKKSDTIKDDPHLAICV